MFFNTQSSIIFEYTFLHNKYFLNDLNTRVYYQRPNIKVYIWKTKYFYIQNTDDQCTKLQVNRY